MKASTILRLAFCAGDYIQSGYRPKVFLEMFMYDDNYGSLTIVEGDGWFNDGDVSQQSSDASGVSVGLVVGPQWTFGADVTKPLLMCKAVSTPC
ncbi:MAG: hypothetical protein U5L01_16550 [Rheinheimera sp.]|nr:hypothetical protein [Rheinheimera sp.]